MNKKFFMARMAFLGFFLAAVFIVSWFQRDYLIALLTDWVVYIEAGIEKNFLSYAIGYVALYVLDSLLALPLASLLAFLAGRFFGVVLGFAFSLIGMIIGAVLAFVAVRYFVGTYFQETYEKKLVRFNTIFSKYGNVFLIFVRFIPVIPFSLINILAAFTSVSLRAFFITTCIGMSPLLLFLVAFGHLSADYATMNMSTLLGWFSLFGLAIGAIIFLIKKYRTVLC